MSLKFSLAALALAASNAIAADAAPPAAPAKAPQRVLDLESLTRSPGVVAASLSPDGKKVAIIEYRYGHSVYISDVKDIKFKYILGEQPIRDGFWIYSKAPRSVMWLNNEIIAINYNIGATAYNLEGKFIANLGERVIRTLSAPDAPVPIVLAYTDIEDRKLARVNALTGAKARLSFPVSGKPVRYTYDKKGEPRVITVSDSTFWRDANTFSHWYKPAGKAEWQKIAEFKVTDDIWVPMIVPEEDNKLIVSSRQGRDTWALFTLDTRTGQLGKMMAGFPDRDVVGFDNLMGDNFDRVTTSAMLPGQIWFDPAWTELQKEVDLALPKRINSLSGNPAGTILVHSSGDVDPGSYYLLDAKDFSMRKFGSYHATINPADMRPVEAVTYPARDGLSIPAYLTLPKDGAKALPTVIMIHGGPQFRDEWAFDADVQLLASRGYAVLQPQFRGSTGFGRKFETAGYGQWGLAMQDDVSAGVDYLVKRGIADPARVCIYGTSYGGYASLWGLIKTPELYKCGISFAGVTDIEMMFNGDADFNSDKIAMELVRSQIGDPKKNKQQFDQVSPLRHAARISAPVLLMHGREDKRVPYDQAKKMLKALKDNGKQVEWLDFPEEGHGVYQLDNQRIYYKKVLEFLDKHIGPASLQASVDQDASTRDAPAPAPLP